MNKNKGSAYRQTGFTLIELLVVIAIIGILSAIVIAFLGNAKNKGNDSKVQSQLKSMIAQAQLFTGTIQAISPTAVGVNSLTGVSGGSLFTDTISSSKSLYSLVKNLPSGTIVYYGSKAVHPISGGRWALAASTSTGSFCVDYTGASFTGATVLTAANASTLYPTIANNSFTCN